MSLFKSKCSKSKLPNMKKIAEHSKVFYLKFTDSSRQEHDAVTVSVGGTTVPTTIVGTKNFFDGFFKLLFLDQLFLQMLLEQLFISIP